MARREFRKRILVGGIPRGGTSLTLELLAAQPGVFGWPGETACLALAQAIWAGGAPNPACREQIEQHARASLSMALIDMQDWNIRAGGDCNAAVAASPQVERLALAVVEACFAAASVRGALAGCVFALDRFLAEFSDEPVLLEKTPDNIFAFPHLAGDPSTLWVITHREPFAVIASLQARAGKDPYASNWETSLEACIGLYVRYARRVIASMRAARSALVAPFETICENPGELVSQIAGNLRLESPTPFPVTDRASDRDAWRAFTPTERWKVFAFTYPVRSLLGYGGDYYGRTEKIIERNLDLPNGLVVTPMSGVFAEEDASRYCIAGEAAFSVFAPRNVDEIELDLFNPPVFGVSNQLVVARDGFGEVIGGCEIPSGRLGRLRVRLDKASPAQLTASGALFGVSVSVTRAVTPVASIPGNRDARTISLVASDWRARSRSASLSVAA